MLISFIGCPCSGKTTTAAQVFAELKRNGTPAEFITEQARMYIAKKKCLQGVDVLALTDADQEDIMHQQLLAEIYMESDQIVVTDSCPLNSLLYMTEAAKKSSSVQMMVKNTLEMDRLIFYCPPVSRIGEDPNRVHNQEQSDQIDRAIPEMLRTFAPNVKIIQLSGDVDQRVAKVTYEITMKVLGI